MLVIELMALTMGTLLIFLIVYESIHYMWFITSSRSRYWDGKNVNSTMYLSWKELRDFYAVNPSRWSYSKTSRNQELKHIYYIKDNYNWIAITVSPLSYMKLLIYYHFKHRKDTKVKTGFLVEVQHDIDLLKEKAQREMDEANRAMENILKQNKEGVKHDSNG